MEEKTLITQLDNKKMKVLEEMAQVNMIVSGMRAEMLKLEQDKKGFISQREKEVFDCIKEVLNESRSLLDETENNYILVHDFYESIKVFANFLSETHENLKNLMMDFDKKTEKDKKELAKQQEEIGEIRKKLKVDNGILGRENAEITKKKQELENIQKKIESERATLASVYNILKK